MAEQTFKSPGFFEREIEIIARPTDGVKYIPAAVVGPAEKGPAFIPTTVSSLEEFKNLFGEPNQQMPSGHAVAAYFAGAAGSNTSLTFTRILGAGSGPKNSVSGETPSAGFALKSSAVTVNEDGSDDTRKLGATQFLVAQHDLADAEHLTVAMFNDNASHTTDMDETLDGGLTAGLDPKVEVIRAMIMLHKDYVMKVSDVSGAGANYTNDVATAASGVFKIKLRDGKTGANATEYTVSLDPSSDKYIAKVLNTDPYMLDSKYHYLYADFPVDDVVGSVTGQKVAILRGDDTNVDKFGNFKSRYTAAQTTSFISQPFGNREYDLFSFAALDDGAYSSGKYKLSIRDLRASTDPNYKYGSFTVELRDVRDIDDAPIVYESFANCSLDPDSERYIARVIGDRYVSLDLDVDSEDEKRLIRSGTFPLRSKRIRVIVNEDVINGEVPDECLPFGFRGPQMPKSTADGKDQRAGSATILTGVEDGNVLAGNANAGGLNFSVLPPLPYRFKLTKGAMDDAGDGTSWGQTYTGEASDLENLKSNYYWGVKSERVIEIYNPNASTKFNEILIAYAKFLGVPESGVFYSASESDGYNSNKFTLSRVAFGRSAIADLTSSLDEFRNAAYIRSGEPAASDYRIDMNTVPDPLDPIGGLGGEGSGDPFQSRVTLATLLAEDKKKFNEYSPYAKFTALFHGGFDGINIFDKDSHRFNDVATSVETGGKASTSGFESGLSLTSESGSLLQGSELDNNIIASYRNALLLMTDEMVTNNKILTVPGIREPLVTDYAADKVRAYGKAIYLMDIPSYDADGQRLFGLKYMDGSKQPDVDITSQLFDSRELNNNYVAVYFPDVLMSDTGDLAADGVSSRRLVRSPASTAALTALANSDRLGGPWFAPAGFRRGALSLVTGTTTRLNAADRDTLYEARINPIANFPGNEFVIFGQKTTQIARTALDRVNVRRLMIDIKTKIQRIAQGLLFEQNNQQTRDRFISSTSAVLSDIKIRQGIDDYRVVMDDTNNTSEDVDNNRLNGKIIVVPTRAVEFIAMDFIITNSGVEFPE